MKRGVSEAYFFAGFIILMSAILSALFRDFRYWYFFGFVGTWLLSDYFASLNNYNTPLQILKKNPRKFADLYFVTFLLGCGIQIVGQFIFRFWSYTYTNSIFGETVLILFYPFILFSFLNTYLFLKNQTKKPVVSFILSMIIGIIIWETPNLYSVSWLYSIPFVSFTIFSINIVVLLGWSLLILLPYYVYNLVVKEK